MINLSPNIQPCDMYNYVLQSKFNPASARIFLW